MKGTLGRAAALVLAAVAVLLVPLACLAYDPAHVESYHVDIDVREDNTYRVTEDIRMSFEENSFSHGMRRDLSLDPDVFFEQDGEFYEARYNIRVTDVDVNEPFETSIEDGELRIRVGEEDTYVDGRTIDYRLTYTYDAGDDHITDFDMFYFGIIGNGWSYPLDNVTFDIHMPKDFDASEVGFSVGPTGTSGYDPSLLQYEVHGNEITGRLDGQLPAYEGVWIRIPLPEGYYVGARTIQPGTTPALWAGGIMAAGALGVFAVGRNRRRPVETVEFEPPDGLTSADVGYIADNMATDKDALSLLLYWADRGFMRIVEMAPKEGRNGKKKKKSPGLVFVKLQDLPPDANEYERVLFDALFEGRDRVSTKDLKYKFADKIRNACQLLGEKWKQKDNAIYTKGSVALSWILCLLAPVPMALLAGVVAYDGLFEAAFGWLLGSVAWLLLAALSVWWMLLRHSRSVMRQKSFRGATIGCLVCVGAASVLLAFLGLQTFGPSCLILVAASLLIGALAPHMRRETKTGLDLLGRVYGFRQFIERAEKPRIRELAEDNPQYFYSVLPYAYVFGLTDLWAEHFASMTLAPPDWYYGYEWDTWTSVYITQSIMNSMSRAQTALATTATSGGGGGSFSGSSGGGFSGGGFGGGGGGSW